MQRSNFNRTVFPSLCSAMLFAALGCSSNDGAPGDESGAPTDSSSTGPQVDLDLDPPERGFQIGTIGQTIEPGQDIEYCEVVELPGTPDDVYYVDRMEVKMTDFSHHLIVNAIEPGSPAEEQLNEVGSIEECRGAMEQVGFIGSQMIGGSQSQYNDRRFHEGVGQIFHGGQKVIFDYHYLNTSTEPVPAKHLMNFHETTKEDVQHLAQSMAFVNLTIDTPPGSQSSFVGECTFDEDVMIGSLIRHTHQWGTDFNVWFAGGEREGEHIWTSHDYELDTEHYFEEPILMPAGTGFRFECQFENDTDENLRFGLEATDEMCILFGGWWDPDTLEPPKRQACVMQEIDEDGVARAGDLEAVLSRFQDGGGLQGDGS